MHVQLPQLPPRFSGSPELLGRGGFGEVFKAHDRLLKRNVAVKLFPATGLAEVRSMENDAPGLVEIFAVASLSPVPVYPTRSE